MMSIMQKRKNLKMKVNRILLYSLIVLFGCNHKGVKISNHLDDTIETVDEFPKTAKSLDKQIADLLEHRNPKVAILLIDSLIAKNPKDGSLFYEKGSINAYNMRFEDAIIYFKIAKKLGFSKKLCDQQISFCEKLIYGKSSQKIRTYNTVI